MKCWNCERGEAVNFSHCCQGCIDAHKERERQERAKERARRYKGVIYADECSTCHTTTKTIWLVTFDSGIGKWQGETTGAWCEDCIYEMVGRKRITSVIEFAGIENVQFIKKLHDSLEEKASQDVCEVLKSVDF